MLERRFTKFSEMTQCNGHYAVQGHSKSPILVLIESSYRSWCREQVFLRLRSRCNLPGGNVRGGCIQWECPYPAVYMYMQHRHHHGASAVPSLPSHCVHPWCSASYVPWLSDERGWSERWHRPSYLPPAERIQSRILISTARLWTNFSSSHAGFQSPTFTSRAVISRVAS